MNKQELFKKLQNMDPSKASRLGFTKDEIDFLKSKTITHKLGFSFDYTEMDYEDKYKYLVLTEDKSKAINPKPKSNLLIEGDNFHALKALKTAGVKVDIIYIDPPYNTGKEFVYNDSFTSEAKTVTSDDPHKHSKWLTFMKKRLEIAKELLSDEGVIFVSIDDNEQAYLKVLMDEIFGEQNFLECLVWEKFHTIKANTKYFSNNHEYILTFARDKESFNIDLLPRDEKQLSNYSNPDNDPRGVWQRGNMLSPKYTPSNDFTYINNEGKSFTPKQGTSWRFSEAKIREMENDGRLKFEPNSIRRKIYLSEAKDGVSPSTIMKHSWAGHTQMGTEELKMIFNDKVFDFPKPAKLIKFLASLVKNKNSVVLDFFAGSGTTGQAVMELNDEDGGNRRFILVTNNERSGVDTNAHPEQGIAQAITYERLFRVINGRGTKGESIKWSSDKDLSKNSLKYLQVKGIDKFEGDFEEIDAERDLYQVEFDKDLDITDFK